MSTASWVSDSALNQIFKRASNMGTTGIFSNSEKEEYTLYFFYIYTGPYVFKPIGMDLQTPFFSGLTTTVGT